MKYDLMLFEKLWQKHSYKEGNNYACDRQAVLSDYKEQTGVAMPDGTVNHYLKRIDREKLYNEKHLKTFNERTDEIIENATDLLNESDLLKAMGLDPNEFETTTNTANRWWLDKGNVLERIRNGQIKINFRKKKFELNQDSIEDILFNLDLEPITVYKPERKGDGLLYHAINDTHFGNATYDDYKGHQSEIVTWNESKQWDTIIIKQGGDFFHTNNSEGTTVAGTKVGHDVDLLKMTQYGLDFMKPIIQTALENSANVKYVYIEGNHDKDIARMFAIFIRELYPQMDFDITDNTFKSYKYQDVFLGFLHGDKPRNANKVANVFFQMFREDIANAKTVEIHTEHLHHEKVKEDMGFVIRTNTTANPDDKWHSENGFIGTRKIFQSFIYNDKSLKAVINIDGE